MSIVEILVIIILSLVFTLAAVVALICERLLPEKRKRDSPHLPINIPMNKYQIIEIVAQKKQLPSPTYDHVHGLKYNLLISGIHQQLLDELIKHDGAIQWSSEPDRDSVLYKAKLLIAIDDTKLSLQNKNR